jgi:hypothetical protein
MAGGGIAWRRNGKLIIDQATKQITNDRIINALLAGLPSRNGWEQLQQM